MDISSKLQELYAQRTKVNQQIQVLEELTSGSVAEAAVEQYQPEAPKEAPKKEWKPQIRPDAIAQQEALKKLVTETEVKFQTGKDGKKYKVETEWIGPRVSFGSNEPALPL